MGGGGGFRASKREGHLRADRRDKGISKGTARRRIRRKRREKIANSAIYFLLAALGILWILPIVGIVVESFRCTGYDPSLGTVLHYLGTENYARLFCETPFLKWFFNTLLVGIVTAVVQTAFQISVGYVFSRFRFRGRKFLMSIIFVLGMIPSALLYYVLGLILNEWRLTGGNAPLGSILVYSASSGIGYAVAKKYFDTLDRSVVESARVDGASEARIFFKIVLPLAKPVIIYTLLMGFMLPWNTFSATNPLPGGYLVADGLIETLKRV